MIFDKEGIKYYKAIKVTTTRGVENYLPYNKVNLDLHEKFKSNLSNEKKEKYKIEVIELTIEEAANLGFAEAYQIINPPKGKSEPKENTTIIELLMKQNQDLAERLAKIEQRKEVEETEPTEESKPNKKK
jgi:hypothetical protein